MKNKKQIIWSILLFVLPFWLIGSAAVAIYFSTQKKEIKTEKRLTISKNFTSDSIRDTYDKIEQWMGWRVLMNTNEDKGLLRMAAMIQGSLGVSNAGYQITTKQMNNGHLIIMAKLMAHENTSDTEDVIILARYDSEREEVAQQIHAYEMSCLLAVAEKIPNSFFTKNIVFVFTVLGNQANDVQQNILETSNFLGLETSLKKKCYLYNFNNELLKHAAQEGIQGEALPFSHIQDGLQQGNAQWWCEVADSLYSFIQQFKVP